VLEEFDPAAPAPLAEIPEILPFPRQQPAKKSRGRKLRQRGALLAAACLLLGLGLALGGMRLSRPHAERDASVALNTPADNSPTWRSSETLVFTSDGNKPLMSKGNPVSPQLKHNAVTTGWGRIGKQVTSLVAATQEQVGAGFQKNGDYDRAATYLVQAHELKRLAHGETDKETIKTSANLARVYEVALNTVSLADDSVSASV